MQGNELLEHSMRHVVPADTTPYSDGSEALKLHFARLNKTGRFHALWHGGSLAGVCYSDGEEIDTLVVREESRRTGLGYALLYAALQNAFFYTDAPMRLYVVDQNQGAFQFYKRCGMRVTGHSARYKICGENRSK